MERIEEELIMYPSERRDDVVILFSAHSLPMKVRFILYIGAIVVSYHLLIIAHFRFHCHSVNMAVSVRSQESRLIPRPLTADRP